MSIEKTVGQVMHGTKAIDNTKIETVDVTQGAAHVANQAIEPGMDSQAWRNWGGAMVEMVEITGVAAAQAITGPCWIYGYQVTAAGTSSTLDLHAGTSAAGINLAPGIVTGTFNVVGYKNVIGPGGGVGVFCPNGIWAVWGGTGAPRVALFVVRSQPG